MKTPELVTTITAVRERVRNARSQNKTVGLVPTMGALHAGHGSLIEAASLGCDFVVVTIFVNPTQFGPSEDYGKYPRTLDQDVELCARAGADLVFAPPVNEMYPAEQLTWVNVEKITDVLCGASRPGHFRGVATVCMKLFSIVGADKAYFGQKDAQQVIVIKRMVADLNMPLEIVACPIAREPSGLAMSSRNKYLSEAQKNDAAQLYKSLELASAMIKNGERSGKKIISEMATFLARTPVISMEYINIVDTEKLEDIEHIENQALIAIAVRIGSTRLIDNILVDVSR